MNKTKQVIIQLLKHSMCRIETKILNEACTPVVFFSSNYLCHKLSRWTRLLPEANISFKDTAPLSTCRCLVSSLYRAPAAEMEGSLQLTDFRTLRRSSSVGNLDNCEYLHEACLHQSDFTVLCICNVFHQLPFFLTVNV